MRRMLIALCMSVVPLTGQAADTLALGAPSRTKFPTFDAAAGKLYIAHTDEVTIVDPATMSVTGHIAGLNAVRDVALAPNGRGYVTSSHAATVTVFDIATNAVKSIIPAGQDANAIVYDPVSRRLFVMNDDDGTITVIDAVHDRAIKTIPLGGGEGVEAAAVDEDGHLYAAHSAGREVIRLDTVSAQVDRHYSLPNCPDPSGLALDPAHHRAFVSCLKGLLVVLDTQTGASVATLPIGPGGQSVIYDARRGRLYSANADTTLSVIQVHGDDQYEMLPSVQTPLMARTAAEDPATGRLFLPVGSTLVIVQP